MDKVGPISDNINIHLFSTSSDITILIIINSTNETYISTYNINDFISINVNFNQFTSISSIYTHLLKFTNIGNNNISFVKSYPLLYLICNNFFISNNEHLILPLSLSTHNNFSHHTVINQLTSIPQQSGTSYPSPANSKLSYFNTFLSFVLLLLVINLYCKYTSDHRLFPSSSIISLNEMKLISSWINPSSYHTYQYKLLYKASRDGDTAEIFHQKCGFKNNTLVLISTTNNWRFGGFTDMSWMDTNDILIDEDDSKITYSTFIFSLNLKTKYPSIDTNPIIKCGMEKGPTFGKQMDIMIVDNCFTQKSKCNSPGSFGNNMQKKNEFNGGEDEFIVKELEVFHVKEE